MYPLHRFDIVLAAAGSQDCAQLPVYRNAEPHHHTSHRPIAEFPDLSLSRSARSSGSSAPAAFPAAHFAILAMIDLSMATAFSRTCTPGTPRLRLFQQDSSALSSCRRLCRRRNALELSLCVSHSHALCIHTTINLASASESSFMSPSSNDRTGPPWALDIALVRGRKVSTQVEE